MLNHFQSLLAHGAWADQRLLAALDDAARDVPIALRELSHVRGAQEVWLARIEGRASTLAVWPALTLRELERVGAQVDSAWRSFLITNWQDDLDRHVAYTNSTGDAFHTPLMDILLHLFTHGQYHRGKVNAALRAMGLAPVALDYILWQRLPPESVR